MTATIFLHDAQTLRISFPWSQASVDAIKAVGGAHFDGPSKTWRAPLAKLDAVLRALGDDAAVAPEVFLAASPRLPVENFMDTCAQGGVTLRVEGERVIGSGGCWTPLLQREIDARAPQLRRLLASGWRQPEPPPAPAPVQPATLDRITAADLLLARGERNARAEAERKERYKAEALWRRWTGGTAKQVELFEEGQR